MMPWIVKWHCIGVLWADPDDGPASPSGCVIDARCVVDGRSGRFGPCRLAHMRGASVVAPEGGGDALPYEDPADGDPIVTVTAACRRVRITRTSRWAMTVMNGWPSARTGLRW